MSDFAEAREAIAHTCPACARPCPAFDEGVEAERARLADLFETHANDGIYSQSEQEVWRSVASIIRKGEGE